MIRGCATAILAVVLAFTVAAIVVPNVLAAFGWSQIAIDRVATLTGTWLPFLVGIPVFFLAMRAERRRQAKLRSPQPATGDQLATSDDWICYKCSESNPASNYTCLGCRFPRV